MLPLVPRQRTGWRLVFGGSGVCNGGVELEHRPVGGAIVAAVDGSLSSIDALRWAVQQARLSGLPLHVISCWQTIENYSLAETDIPDSIFRDKAEASLRTALEEVDTAGLSVVAAVEHGYPPQVLIEASRSASLLVLGSRGHGGFVGMLLGSVSQHCVAHAHCPVVVIRHQA